MGRLLHYVYKIPHRGESVKFYRELGMKSLRHEEFTEGCEAQVRKPRRHLRSRTDRIFRDPCRYGRIVIHQFNIIS